MRKRLRQLNERRLCLHDADLRLDSDLRQRLCDRSDRVACYHIRKNWRNGRVNATDLSNSDFVAAVKSLNGRNRRLCGKGLESKSASERRNSDSYESENCDAENRVRGLFIQF